MASSSIDMPSVAASSAPYDFRPSFLPENTVVVDAADTSSNVIPMPLDILKPLEIPKSTLTEFREVLIFWSVMVVMCVGSSLLAILDITKMLDFVHPYLWFTVSGASAILAYTHFLRLKQLWLSR